MLHQSRFSTAVKRTTLVLLQVCLFAMLALAAPKDLPMATNVTATTSGQSTLITVSGTAPLSYAVSHPDARTIFVELPGVDTSRLAQHYKLATSLVEEVSIERGRKTGLRVVLRVPVLERSQLADNSLVLVLSPKTPAEAAHVVKDLGLTLPTEQESATMGQQAKPSPSPSPTPRPGVTLSPAKMQQADQGQHYGEPGFVGEPINLNLVNADIRDLLNYITEQYGINFVIDSSVTAVPVTVNVQDVPWNVALDAVLKANRLGVEVSGNILRVATTEVLAKEADTQKVLKDSRLDASVLVTEFIRLNYSRASGVLSAGGGASGNFAGGMNPAAGSSSGSSSGSPGAGSAGSDQGILPVVQRRLSRRGSVEVDGRSNTLIITDVKENIDAIRQLVTLLDQPEPQVEIETRIVIANRSFSRDLGVQLNALAINTSTGGTAGFGTAPGSPLSGASGGSGNTIGLRPAGIPQGILNPSGALGASLPNTVIGLTTGVIGTAQISALITAAESRGQVKIVATPRVTALNNRKAEISSGQQIPVTTPQTGAGGGGGGALIFTTTFVSVPLRLEVTPQITDAGTVVLHVIAENNSVNTAIAINGTPGIDTQRMETEVLVPDGGTTVVGGVLGENDATTQNRTPGVANIPILGNLFKRKLVTRQSNEILFFITPHIYRPDYQGRPTTPVVGTGTGNRTVTIPQPVPLGNPQSNTPTQQQQQQQQQQQTPAPSTVPPTRPNGARP
jgi:type IV pilus assembly protein PilQ